MRRAEPYEQTAAQFHNRPDVFVHGRYERTMPGSRELDLHDSSIARQGFHAGTEAAAEDRLMQLGVPWADHSPRFYHGRVDPGRMRNTAVPGDWEHKENSLGGAVRQAWDPGRLPDEGEEWGSMHHGSYYRNDYEDKGSTSVVLPVEHIGGRYIPQNFQTHREAISEALRQRRTVPAHVKAVYKATGGTRGPRSVHHALFTPNTTSVKGKYAKVDDPILGFTSTKDMATFGNPGYQPPF